MGNTSSQITPPSEEETQPPPSTARKHEQDRRPGALTPPSSLKTLLRPSSKHRAIDNDNDDDDGVTVVSLDSDEDPAQRARALDESRPSPDAHPQDEGEASPRPGPRTASPIDTDTDDEVVPSFHSAPSTPAPHTPVRRRSLEVVIYVGAGMAGADGEAKAARKRERAERRARKEARTLQRAVRAGRAGVEGGRRTGTRGVRDEEDEEPGMHEGRDEEDGGLRQDDRGEEAADDDQSIDQDENVELGRSGQDSDVELDPPFEESRVEVPSTLTAEQDDEEDIEQLESPGAAAHEKKASKSSKKRVMDFDALEDDEAPANEQQRKKRKRSKRDVEATPELAAPDTAKDLVEDSQRVNGEAPRPAKKQKKNKTQIEEGALELDGQDVAAQTSGDAQASKSKRKRKHASKEPQQVQQDDIDMELENGVDDSTAQDEHPASSEQAPAEKQKKSRKKGKQADKTAVEKAVNGNTPGEIEADPVSAAEDGPGESFADWLQKKENKKASTPKKPKEKTTKVKKPSRKSMAAEAANESADHSLSLADDACRTPTGSGVFLPNETQAIHEVVTQWQQEHNLSDEQFRSFVQPGQYKGLSSLLELMEEACPQRDRRSIRRFVQRKYNPFNRGPWTAEDDQRLREAHELKPDKWVWIGERLGRLPADCRDRWREFVGLPDRASGRWNDDETAELEQVIAECVQRLRTTEFSGRTDITDRQLEEHHVLWSVVSAMLDGKRSRLQCQSKWQWLRAAEDRAEEVPAPQPSSSKKRKSTKQAIDLFTPPAGPAAAATPGPFTSSAARSANLTAILSRRDQKRHKQYPLSKDTVSDDAEMDEADGEDTQIYDLPAASDVASSQRDDLSLLAAQLDGPRSPELGSPSLWPAPEPATAAPVPAPRRATSAAFARRPDPIVESSSSDEAGTRLFTLERGAARTTEPSSAPSVRGQDQGLDEGLVDGEEDVGGVLAYFNGGEGA